MSKSKAKDLPVPLTTPGDWTFKDKSGKTAKVSSRFYFEARKEAAQKLGANPEEIECIHTPYKD